MPQPTTIPQQEAAMAALRPLCVDLDGTLVKSDTLVDSLLALVRSRPASVFRLPDRLVAGRAALKAFVTNSVSLDVVHLPYNRALLQFLNEQHGFGRELYLATGANVHLAHRVADHLGIFAGVLGSDESTNLTGTRKLGGLLSRLESDAFDYIGNASADLPLLAQATQAMVANPSLALRMKLKARGIRTARAFIEREPLQRSMLKAARLHQWAKNLLVFVPCFARTQ